MSQNRSAINTETQKDYYQHNLLSFPVPPEILIHIFSYLTEDNSLSNLMRTCSLFRNTLSSEPGTALWKIRLNRLEKIFEFLELLDIKIDHHLMKNFSKSTFYKSINQKIDEKLSDYNVDLDSLRLEGFNVKLKKLIALSKNKVNPCRKLKLMILDSKADELKKEINTAHCVRFLNGDDRERFQNYLYLVKYTLERNELACFKVLINFKINTDYRNEEKKYMKFVILENTLLEAIKKGKTDFVDYMLKTLWVRTFNASTTTPTTFGKYFSALNEAMESNHLDVIRIFCQYYHRPTISIFSNKARDFSYALLANHFQTMLDNPPEYRATIHTKENEHQKRCIIS